VAYNNWSKLINILDGGIEFMEELPDYRKQAFLYLRIVYQVALQSMEKGTNWSVCCQMANDEIENLGITTRLGFQTIRGFNQDF
jgi:hypothetical protein